MVSEPAPRATPKKTPPGPTVIQATFLGRPLSLVRIANLLYSASRRGPIGLAKALILSLALPWSGSTLLIACTPHLTDRGVHSSGHSTMVDPAVRPEPRRPEIGTCVLSLSTRPWDETWPVLGHLHLVVGAPRRLRYVGELLHPCLRDRRRLRQSPLSLLVSCLEVQRGSADRAGVD